MDKFHAALVTSGKSNDVWILAPEFFASSIEERLEAAGVKVEPMQRSAQAYALAGEFLF